MGDNSEANARNVRNHQRLLQEERSRNEKRLQKAQQRIQSTAEVKAEANRRYYKLYEENQALRKLLADTVDPIRLGNRLTRIKENS